MGSDRSLLQCKQTLLFRVPVSYVTRFAWISSRRRTLRNDAPGRRPTPNPVAILLHPRTAASNHCVWSPPLEHNSDIARLALSSREANLGGQSEVLEGGRGKSEARVVVMVAERE